MPAVVSDAFVMAALKERGITNERILDGLLLAFHHDEDDDIDGAEFEALITSVDEMLQREKVPNDVPPDCKAFLDWQRPGMGSMTMHPIPTSRCCGPRKASRRARRRM